MFQRKSILLVGVPILLALIWSAGWFWVADRFQGIVEEFGESRRADGVDIVWDSITVSGFPVRFDTRIARVRATWKTEDRDIAWTGPDVVLRPFAEGPGVASFRSPGTHGMVFRRGTRELSFRGTAEVFRGRIEVGDSGRANALRGRVEPLTIELEDSGTVRLARMAFDWSRLTGETEPGAIHPETTEQSIALIVDGIDLSRLALDRDVGNLLGTEVEKMAGRLVIRGDIEPGGINSDTLAQWRDAGGTLEAENIELVWGPLRLAGNGTVSLDAALQPLGAFSGEISGLDALLDLLEARGQIRPQQAAIARIALAVLTRPSPDGGPPVAMVPVAIQDRVLSVGPVPLLTFAPIVWD